MKIKSNPSLRLLHIPGQLVGVHFRTNNPLYREAITNLETLDRYIQWLSDVRNGIQKKDIELPTTPADLHFMVMQCEATLDSMELTYKAMTDHPLSPKAQRVFTALQRYTALASAILSLPETRGHLLDSQIIDETIAGLIIEFAGAHQKLHSLINKPRAENKPLFEFSSAALAESDRTGSRLPQGKPTPETLLTFLYSTGCVNVAVFPGLLGKLTPIITAALREEISQHEQRQHSRH